MTERQGISTRARRCRRALAGALAGAALAAGLSAASATTIDRLLAAFWTGDRLEIARTGWNLGARALGDELESADRARIMAALAAAPHAEDAWTLLPRLAHLARGADRPRAVAAARAGAAIARELDPDGARALDVPAELLREPLAAWRRVAGDRARWPDVRVDALETSELLARAIGEGAGWAAETLAGDDEPEVRRAVLELLPQPLGPDHRALAAERARTDTEPAVAASALQALCGGIAAGDSAEPILEALGEAGLDRLRALLFDPPEGAAPAAMLDAALCAAAAGDLDSRRALSRFQGRLDPDTSAVLGERLAWLE